MVYPEVGTQVQVPEDTPNGTLFVCVAGTYGRKQRSNVTGECVSLEDCACGYWKIQHLSQAHAGDCEWLMAHCDGKIKGVWKIDRQKGWLPAADVRKQTWPEDQRTDYPSSACYLTPVSQEVWDRFVGKDVRLGRCWNPLRGYFR